MRRAVVCAVVALALASPAAALAHRGAPRIVVLSNRADLISGGNALVAVRPRSARVTLNGADVTSELQAHRGRLVGVITGLVDGRNRLVAHTRRGRSARITIVNHPIGGPVFAGPQVQPWICKTIPGFPAPQDAQCNAPATTSFAYMNATSHQFAPYDPASPPPAGDIASTTTDRGQTVPYIVRIERGAMDRGLYEVAVLERGWNHKLLYQFGGGTAPHHSNGQPLADVSPLTAPALARGFMVANNSLNTRGMNSNDVVSAEAVMMLQEHVREAFGHIRATLGAGCSGGSIQQQVIAADYPGLLDGIQPNCSYQDSWTTANEVADCGLLENYFTHHGDFTSDQQAAVMGEQPAAPTSTICFWWTQTFTSVSTPSLASNCDLPAALVYPNPGGVRCTPQDYESHVWGFRPSDGFAKRPFDNVGVQYGLGALRSGAITPEQFVALNEGIGGIDIDNNFEAARTMGDPGSERTAYRTGKITSGRPLGDLPIIDLRGSHNTNDIHSDYHSYVMRARLDAANGGHGNQIIWTWAGGPGLFQNIAPDATISVKSLDLLDRWVAAVQADRRHISQRRKVVLDKPADAVDACFVGATDMEITDAAACAARFPHFADPRIVAGSPFTDDVEQCRLTRPRRSDYPVTFTDDQWARLRAAFPNGVCDFSRPGVGTRPSVPWLDYSVIGGRPLGPPPRSHPAG